jgi:hypothetical protein
VKRFWDKVDKSGECWIWKGTKFRTGYGMFRFEGKVGSSHRASWKLSHGDIMEGMCVLHTCDNKLCVNPQHLWLGSQQDNIDDMWRKGRWKTGGRSNCIKGMMHYKAKITDQQVKEIRVDLRVQRLIAKTYGISRSLVSHIKTKRTWAHI